jgi:hypothetical protein
MEYTRRQIGKLALSAIPGCELSASGSVGG